MVSVRKKRGRSSARRGLVVFHDMESAKKMFAAQPHILYGAKIGVSAAGKNQADDEDTR
ncbi:unnamed protein product [Dibothriocephalus latus]|uniref:RRM domain-containing protein n=1 Tax=Dibothriocephalus latus TaxID=60516 RepID=A0A3P7P3V5_DIBLA|nr:unnamed protein product [Dibothriocephalus latus]